MNANDQQIIELAENVKSIPMESFSTGTLAFLHGFSTFELSLFLVFFGLLVSTILPYALRYKLSIEPSEGFAKGAEESFKVLISLTLLMMAFCLVRVQGDHRSVDDLVSRESTVILKLDRAYGAFGGEEGDILRKNLFTYTKTLIEVEWPLLVKGKRSDLASAQLALLSQQSKSLDPKTAPQQIARAEILAAFTQLSDLREARLSASKLELPNYLWHAIATALFLLTILSWFQSPIKKAVPYVAGVSSALMLLLSILVTTAGIFEGGAAVTSRPLIEALAIVKTHIVQTEQAAVAEPAKK